MEDLYQKELERATELRKEVMGFIKDKFIKGEWRSQEMTPFLLALGGELFGVALSEVKEEKVGLILDEHVEWLKMQYRILNTEISVH